VDSTVSARADVVAYIADLLADVLGDTEIVDINEYTRLDALGLQSISLVYLIAEIQDKYRLDDALFDRLRSSRTRVTELSVGNVVDLVCNLSEQHTTHTRRARP